MELNLNYLKGLVDSIVNYTTEFTQEIDISDKECTHYVYVHQNGFAVRFDWIEAYVYDKVSNEDEPDYDHQILYFSKTEKKETISDCIESIEWNIKTIIYIQEKIIEKMLTVEHGVARKEMK